MTAIVKLNNSIYYIFTIKKIESAKMELWMKDVTTDFKRYLTLLNKIDKRYAS